MAAGKMSETINRILDKMPKRGRLSASVCFFRASDGSSWALAGYAGGAGGFETFRQVGGTTPEGAAVNLLHEVER